MKKILFLIIASSIIYSSCCERDEYLPADPVDEVVGIYQAEQFKGLVGYKIKVIKISADTIKLTPYIGNEMYTYNAIYKELQGGKKLFSTPGGETVWFYINEDPIRIYSYKLPEYEGWKVE